MVEARLAGLLLLLAMSCSAPPSSKLPRSNLLRYSASGTTGGVSFVVRQNGTVAYESTLAGQTRRVDGKVTQAELDALSSELHANECCSLLSEQKQGKPDEPRPSYSVRMGDLDCEVALWDGEIGESKKAQACLKALHDFGNMIAKKATFAE